MRPLILVAGVALCLLFVVPPPHDGDSNQLLPSTQYRSTDFDVHRYWTAVTATLPMNEWYRANHSIWTLDYPPLFAYFTGALAYSAKALVVMCETSTTTAHNYTTATMSLAPFPGQLRHPAAVAASLSCTFIDKALLNVTAVAPFTRGIVNFLRTSVVLCSTLPFALAVGWAAKPIGFSAQWVAVFGMHPSLILLDNVHFQYNGLVYALVFLSLGLAFRNRPVAAITMYAVLVCTKHLFLYYAFGFGVWLIAHFMADFKWYRAAALCVQLAAAVTTVLGVALGPIIVAEMSLTGASFMTALVTTLQTIKTRLFPFGRGLCHAYWAPNAYPLYNVADALLVRLLGVPAIRTSVNTRGLVELSSDPAVQLAAQSVPSHTVLPSLTPGVTSLLVLLAFTVLFVVTRGSGGAVVRGGSKGSLLLRAMFCSSAAFFLFSWHVHEKSLVSVAIPVMVYAAAAPATGASPNDVRAALLLSFLAAMACAPLFFTVRECTMKYAFILGHDALATVAARSNMASVNSAPDWWRRAAYALLMPASVVVDWNAIGVRAGVREDRFAPLLVFSCLTSFFVVCTIVRLAHTSGGARLALV